MKLDRTHLTRACAIPVVWGVLSSASLAQELYDEAGSAGGDDLGASVSDLGDINLDGFADVLVGSSPGPAATEQGLVQIYSGQEMAQGVKNVLGSIAGRGRVVQGMGDLDGDGLADFLIAHPRFNGGAGRVTVYSSSSGFPILFEFLGSSGSRLGRAVDNAGDVNNDGTNDFIVASNLDVRVHSGSDGSVLRVHTGIVGEGDYGFDVAGIGDFDDDDHADYAVSQYNVSLSNPNCPTCIGSVYIYSGTNGAMTRRLGPDAQDGFGRSIAGVGDFDADGKVEMAIGAPGFFESRGRLYVLSPDTLTFGLINQGGSPFEGLGYSVAGAGDMDNDGFPELTVSAQGPLSSHLRLYQGGTQVLISNTAGGSSGRGRAISSAGDVSGSGMNEILVGSPLHDMPGAFAGRLNVYTLCSGAVVPYGYSCQGPGGFAVNLDASGCPLSTNTIVLQQTGGPPSNPFILFTGLAPASGVSSNGCFLGLGNILNNIPGAFSAAGTWSLTANLSSVPPGTTVYMQSFYADSVGDVRTSNGLKMLIQ